MRNFMVEPPNIDFLKIRKIGYGISLSLLILSFVLFFTKGFNLGLDFTGGTSIQIKFNQQIRVSDVRNLLKDVDLADSLIQEVGTNKDEVEIRVPAKKGSSSVVLEKVKKSIR